MRYSWLAACFALMLHGCGSGVICFGTKDCNDDDDDERTVTVDGNVDSVTPPNAVRSLVVFAYTKLVDPDPENNLEPQPFTVFKYGESVVAGDDDKFEVSRVGRGDITIVVLLDDPDPDGSIDCSEEPEKWTCDDCSVLLDGGDLSDVSGGRRVTIENLDVNFDTTRCPNGEPIIANCGCSVADDIVISRDDNGGGSSNDDGN